MGAALLPSSVQAQTWQLGGVANTDYNTASNWSPNTVPNAAGQTAIFAGAGSTTIGVSSAVAPDGWTFSGTSQSYTITGSAVTFTNGLTNNANSGQIISVASNIGGSGDVTQNGASSTLVMSGSNSYTGGTFVELGTLRISGSGTLGATSQNTQVLGGTLDLGGTNQTQTVLQQFAGTVQTTGATGLSVVQYELQGGTLASDAKVTASGTLDMRNGIVNGVLAGSAALSKTTIGTLTLSGVNTYTGETTVSSGVMAISGAGSILASSFVTVGDGSAIATLDISATNAGTSVTSLLGATDGIVTLGNQTLTSTAGNSGNIFAGVIKGNGGLTISGGVQNISGVNTYTGVTTINSGAVLAILGSGSIASSSKVVNNGDLDLSGGSAPGTSIKSLAGTNANATVFLSSQPLTITAANDSFAGSIQDNGGIVLAGGTQTLAGNNSYTGTTTINGGTLIVNGTIASSSLTTVNAGGMLSGTGTVGATTIAGGTLAPGNGIAGSSMNFSGALMFQSAATFMVQLNPSTASFANVTGAASLGGTVNANFAAGGYVSKQYTILKATGGVNGSFNPTVVSTNLPSNFHTSLSYDGHDAFLNLALNFVVPAGLNGNQQNVGNALGNFLNATGSIPMVFGALTPNGLTQISGETATGSQQTTFDAMTQFMGLMTDPSIDGRGDSVTGGSTTTPFAEEIDAANAYAAKDPARSKSERDAYAAIYRGAPAMAVPFTPRWSSWAAGFGGSQATDGNAALGSNSTTSRLGAVAVGADYRFSPDTVAGFALAGGGTNFSVANGGTGHSDLFQAGAFVRHTVGAAYVSGALAYGWQDITTDRTVTITGLDHLRAQFNANAWSGRLEGGYRFMSPVAGGIGITPYAAAQFVSFDLPAYAEQAIVGTNNFALAYGARDVTDARSELGIRTDKSWVTVDGLLTLRGRLAWAHDCDPGRSIGATFQALPGASFVVNGATQASESALVTAAVEKKWRNGWSAAATFEGEFSNVTASYAGKGVVRYAW